jgi:hypothetical protein
MSKPERLSKLYDPQHDERYRLTAKAADGSRRVSWHHTLKNAKHEAKRLASLGPWSAFWVDDLDEGGEQIRLTPAAPGSATLLAHVVEG